ncbi:hypothetical protein RRG08_062629 [Elysia crispata]|uniref:Uncharacterized protein n=1 Tax=Elysia crispata TaxID=231223 RepID=A0AAE1D6U4_9GAST|nr:hypothetical protein RRG08_062629 [Elysia crispata]
MPGQKSSIVCDSSGNHGVLTIGGGTGNARPEIFYRVRLVWKQWSSHNRGVVAQAMPGQKSSIVCDSSGNHGVLTIGGGTGNARPEIFYRVRLVWKPWSSHNRGWHRQCQARNLLSCASHLETMEFSQ